MKLFVYGIIVYFCINHSFLAMEKDEIEMETFLDYEFDTKLVPWILADNYNIAIINSIITHTFKHNQVPENTLNIFEQLLENNAHFYQLKPFIHKKVDKLSLQYPNKNAFLIKNLFDTYIETACNNKIEKNNIAQLARIQNRKIDVNQEQEKWLEQLKNESNQSKY
ncbi:MAG: hypothetical protein WDZ41_04490 [Candidatus Babeliales bacterium]